MHISQSIDSSISLTIFRIIKQEGASSSELLSCAPSSELIGLCDPHFFMTWCLIQLRYKVSFAKHSGRTLLGLYTSTAQILGQHGIYLPFSYVYVVLCRYRSCDRPINGRPWKVLVCQAIQEENGFTFTTCKMQKVHYSHGNINRGTGGSLKDSYCYYSWPQMVISRLLGC